MISISTKIIVIMIFGGHGGGEYGTRKGTWGKKKKKVSREKEKVSGAHDKVSHEHEKLSYAYHWQCVCEHASSASKWTSEESER